MKLNRLIALSILAIVLSGCITFTAPTPTQVPASPTVVPASPTPVIIVVTATPLPPATPVPATPTSLPTPTPLIVVITATPPPSATPTPTAMPTRSYPAPMFIGPFKNETLYPGDIVIRWEWPFELGEDEYFEVLGWKEIKPERHSLTWTKERSWRFVLNAGNYHMFPWISGLGQYYFAVKVIRGKDGKWLGDLSPESAPYPWRW